MDTSMKMAQKSADAERGRAVLLARGWLADMPDDFAAAVLGQAHWRRVSAGEAVIIAGGDGGMCGIAEGTAEVANEFMPSQVPRLHLVHAGFWAGYRPLVLGRPRQISMTARTDMLWAYVPLPAMQRLLADQPGWWQHIAQLCDQNTELAINAWADLTNPSSRARAIAVLLRVAGCRFSDPASHDPIEIRASHDELAAMAVMSRNTLSLALHDLNKSGEIHLGYRSITLNDPAALRSCLDQG